MLNLSILLLYHAPLKHSNRNDSLQKLVAVRGLSWPARQIYHVPRTQREIRSLFCSSFESLAKNAGRCEKIISYNVRWVLEERIRQSSFISSRCMQMLHTISPLTPSLPRSQPRRKMQNMQQSKKTMHITIHSSGELFP